MNRLTDDGAFTQQRFSQDSGVHSQSLLSDFYSSSCGSFPSDPRRAPMNSGRPRFGAPPPRPTNSHVHALLTELRSEMELIPRSLNNAVEAGTNFLSSGIEETTESLKALQTKADRIVDSLHKFDENDIAKIINYQLEIKESLLELSKTVAKQGLEIDRMSSQIEEVRSLVKDTNNFRSPSLLPPGSPAIVRRGVSCSVIPRFRRSLLDS